MTDTPLVAVRGLTKHFPVRRSTLRGAPSYVHAVEGIDFAVGRREIVGLVGESGSGKSTVARLLMRLETPTAGAIAFDGAEISTLDDAAFQKVRRRMQIIFQDPFGSLDPRMRVDTIVGEGMAIHGLASGRERRERVAKLLADVGLSGEYLTRYPHEFSGGQRQRIGIARALAVEPEFIIADEPVSALDVSIQAQIINLLLDIQERLGLAMLFISHDLGVVEYIADRVIVMYLGRIMETARTEALFAGPRHPYTAALLAAAPVPDPDRRREMAVLRGDIPSPINPPSGCVFRTRCRFATPDCATAVPPLRAVAEGHMVACIRDDLDLT